MAGAVRSPTVPVSAATLHEIAALGVAVPTFDRRGLRPRIAHIGVGGFHRAHMALYTHELATGGSDWGIGGVGVLPADARMAEALRAQDHLYTLVERGTGEPRVTVIGSIIDYHLVADDPAAGATLFADPGLAILSLTVTEAGYVTPSATFDMIAAGLEQRRSGGAGALSILSCDNLTSNGDAARQATLTAAAARNESLARWVEENCSFPNSMVDRITPVTSAEDQAWLADTCGIDDRWPVVAEPFRQWVMEDVFAAGRPRWDDVGVLFTADVRAWELYKLRLLNAGHSSMAYLSALAGLTHVDEAMTVPEVRRFLEDLLYREAVPALSEIPGHPRDQYADSVLARFANTGVRDQIARLCIDGTAKFPTFLIPTVAHHLARGGPIERSALALAGWARYLAVVPVEEQAFDASGDAARAHARGAVDDPLRFLLFDEVFPPAVRDHHGFRTAFRDACRRLADVGPLAAMAG